MPSVVPGYEYDVFISYRHNDNLDGWVTEFVQNLDKELKSTIKEPLSIYFDKNPHDGLLETHHVDKSLEGKLKCLIFIPILSQTYADSKSFAWQYEFCTFNKLANDSELGRDVKLVNGNVASRILPIKIHDLDNEDTATIEREIGGALRSIDFIYKEPGVNRPLKSTDNKSENQNKTDYRNQVNKIANAIKNVLNSIHGSKTSAKTSSEHPARSATRKKQTISIAIAALLVLLLASTLLYFKVDSSSASVDKSIAVLAFDDMSPTHDQEYLGDGISEEIINVLAQMESLKVIGRSSSFQFKGKNEDLRIIGTKLGVSTVLEGSVIRVGDRIKVTAQLIRATDGSHIWSKRFDQDASNIFQVYDEIAKSVAEAFKTTLQPSTSNEHKTQWNAEAYKLYQQGVFFHNRGMKGDREKAKDFLSGSIKLDSTHAVVWAALSHYYMNSPDKERLRYINKAIALDTTLSESILPRALFYMQRCEFKKADEDLKRIIRNRPSSPRALRNTGEVCSQLGYHDLAIAYAEKAVQMDPLQPFSFQTLGRVYMSVGNFNKAIEAFSEADKFTDRKTWVDDAFIAYLLNGDSIHAKKFRAHFIVEHGADSLYFAFVMAQCTGRLHKADLYLSRWLKLNPPNNFAVARAYAVKRDKTLMLKFLEKAGEKKEANLFYLMANPEFIPYRNDPEFIAFKKKLNFPDV